MQAATKGSIWTVPAIGQDAMCLVVSHVRGVSRGRPEYQVLPLYLPDLISTHTAHDFLIRPSETDLGVALYAALWNTRPILQTDMGTQVGQVTTEVVSQDLRDAQLQLVDPRIRVSAGRLGSGKVSGVVNDFRSQQLNAWRQLSGRVFAPLLGGAMSKHFVVDNEWKDFSRVTVPVLEQGDALSNSALVMAIGATIVYLSMAVGRPETKVTVADAPIDLDLFAETGHGVVGSNVHLRVNDPEGAQMLLDDDLSAVIPEAA